MPGGAAQTRARAGRLAGVGPVARRPRPGLRARSAPDGADHPARWPRTCPMPSGPGWPPPSAPRPATPCSSRPGTANAARELLGAARLEIGHRCGLIDDVGLVVPLGGGRADVRGGRRGRLDGGAPPVHRAAARVGRQVRRPSPAARWPTPTTSCATATRSAAARSVSTGRDAAAGVRRDRAVPARRPARSSASCSTRSSTGRRRTAASRSAGTAWSCCWPGADTHPRRDRLPQGGLRPRPADRRPHPDHPRSSASEAGIDAVPATPAPAPAGPPDAG